MSGGNQLYHSYSKLISIIVHVMKVLICITQAPILMRKANNDDRFQLNMSSHPHSIQFLNEKQLTKLINK